MKASPPSSPAPHWSFPAASKLTSIEGFDAACAHYFASDFPLFCNGYEELSRLDLNGKTVVELACGRGDLAVSLAKRFPNARLIAIDRYPESGAAIRKATEQGLLPKLTYRCGDAFDLGFLEEGSVDLVFGQAALHHLANDAHGLARETSRVLRPGGRLFFLFEPLGHNWLVSAVRAIQVSRHQMCDESNLFDATFRNMLKFYNTVEVRSFNMTGYFLKGLPSPWAVSTARVANWLDRQIARRWKKAPLFGANANILFHR